MALDTMTMAMITSIATGISKKYQSIGIVNVQYVAPNTLKFTLANNTTQNVAIPSLHTHVNLSDLEKLSVVSGKLYFDGQPIGGSSNTTADINVIGTTQGLYSDGNIIPMGTSLETIVKNMLQTIIPPTYISPTLSIVGSGVLNVESGTNLTLTITPTFTQNDGGTVTNYSVTKNGTSVYTNATVNTYSSTAFVIGDETINYQATVTYNSGAIKNDNTGNPSPTGSIPSGSKVSNIISYVGKRNAFYGTLTNTKIPSISSDIRGLSGKTLGITNGSTFNVNVASGTKHICIAYPDTLQGITQIKSVNMNSDIKDVFTLITISVNDANGSNPVNYKVYYYNPATAFPSADLLQIII